MMGDTTEGFGVYEAPIRCECDGCGEAMSPSGIKCPCSTTGRIVAMSPYDDGDERFGISAMLQHLAAKSSSSARWAMKQVHYLLKHGLRDGFGTIQGWDRASQTRFFLGEYIRDSRQAEILYRAERMLRGVE